MRDRGELAELDSESAMKDIYEKLGSLDLRFVSMRDSYLVSEESKQVDLESVGHVKWLKGEDVFKVSESHDDKILEDKRTLTSKLKEIDEGYEKMLSENVERMKKSIIMEKKEFRKPSEEDHSLMNVEEKELFGVTDVKKKVKRRSKVSKKGGFREKFEDSDS